MSFFPSNSSRCVKHNAGGFTNSTVVVDVSPWLLAIVQLYSFLSCLLL